MRQYLSFVLILLTFSVALAQNNRFFYEYKYKLDSLHRDSIKTEMMVLDVSKDGSFFQSQVKLVSDSITTEIFKKAKQTGSYNIDFTSVKFPKVNLDVVKSYPGFTTTVYLPIDSELFALTTEKLNWKIWPDKSEIEEVKVQKATTDFGGRHWIAWFANDIQIQDGPYRFSGLPGLILKIEDTKGDHSFIFKGNRKRYDENLNLPPKPFSRAIAVSDKKFNEQWNAYKKDPAAGLRKAKSGGNGTIVAVATFGGKSMDSPEMIKQTEKEAKERFAKENNPIELTLYK